METNNQHTDNGNKTNENPERHQSEQENAGVAAQREQQQQHTGGDRGSYSEQVDVTPPNHHDFPTEGPAAGDFSSRPHGRTTGRMIDHEPGTEGI